MKIAVRVDATAELGAGHAMRTLTLANVLRARGHQTTFVARRMPPHLRDAMTSQGHGFVPILESEAWVMAPGAEGWTPSEQTADASAFVAAVGGCDWALCDHYGLGQVWERQTRAAGIRVLAIDDMGRAHACDMLLDQNYYAVPEARYAPDAAPQKLLGPRYALLRPEFAKAREGVRPREGDVRRILVCMGGADAGNSTSVVLDAIELGGLAGVALDIVIGQGHLAQLAIAARCARRSNWTLHVQTSRMAELLAAADLAIGAGGSATWERCALGVPTLGVELAENQREIIREGARAGFLWAPDDAFDVPHLAAHLARLAADGGMRRRMSEIAMGITDGHGAERVADAIEQSL